MPTINVLIDAGTGGITHAWATGGSVVTVVTNSATASCNIIWFSSTASTGATTMCHPAFSTDVGYANQLAQAQAMQGMLAQQMMLSATSTNTMPLQQFQQRVPSAEEARELRARDEARQAARVQARTRARDLLLEHLTPEQRETFENSGWFVVEGGKTKKRYRVRTTSGVAGNIDELGHNDQPVARYCGHASSDIPEHDQFLAQKLMLEHDEEAYRRLANRRSVG